MTHDADRLLERFFDQTITPDENAELNTRMATNPALADEFRWQNELARAFAQSEARAWKTRLQEEEQEMNQPLRVVWKRPGWIMAAAAAMVAAVAALWFLQPAQQSSDAELFAQNFSPFENRFADRERGEAPANTDDFREKMRVALVPYDQKNYAAALEALNLLMAAGPEQQATLDFYRADCFLAEKKYGEAAVLLQQVSEQPGFYQAPSLWHLALAHLSAGHKTETIAALRVYLAHKDGKPERTRAEKLLNALK